MVGVTPIAVENEALGSGVSALGAPTAAPKYFIPFAGTTLTTRAPGLLRAAATADAWLLTTISGCWTSEDTAEGATSSAKTGSNRCGRTATAMAASITAVAQPNLKLRTSRLAAVRWDFIR